MLLILIKSARFSALDNIHALVTLQTHSFKNHLPVWLEASGPMYVRTALFWAIIQRLVAIPYWR